MVRFLSLLIMLVAPSVKAATITLDDTQMECLAKNVYFEARNQSHVGKIAVAQVVLNRVVDKRYPMSICEVIEQAYTYKSGFPIRHKCQFSWFCDGLSDEPRDTVAWKDALRIASDAVLLWNASFDVTEGSTHYHTKQVFPKWRKTLTHTTAIDDHLFYRWEV